MRQADVIELVHDQLFPILKRQREHLHRIDRWYRWDHEPPQLPKRASSEHKALVELSRTPWLGLVVTAVAQMLYVDGYRSPDGDDAAPWRIWEANQFTARQVPLHRAVLAFGYAYATALPGQDDAGESMTVLRGHSPRKMAAIYGDDVEDDWPMYALRGEPQPGKTWALRMYDEDAVYYLSADADGDSITYIEDRGHGAGVCPVVRYSNMLDLDGRETGEVEPFIPVAARINKTDYDRMLAQHFNSWKVRAVAGMAEPDDEGERDRVKMLLRQEDLLVAEDPDTKFTTLDETPLNGFIDAHESDIETLAAVTQTPNHALTGKMINLSAEALAAAEANLGRKVTERKHAFGKSHDQLLRLAAALQGDGDAARDTTAHVTWADMESRSLAQAVDALGKAAQMLGVPPQGLWARIPGVTKTDVEEWQRMAEQSDALGQLNQIIERQMTPAPEQGEQPGSAGAVAG